GLDGVADVLAVALADLAEEAAVGGKDGAGVATVGAGLFAADVELGGAVDGGLVEGGTTPSWFDRLTMRAAGSLGGGGGPRFRGGCAGRRRLQRLLPAWL